ncbi:MAG: molybdenum cofactor guanylyltransferase [Acidobacteria bacterium]|nr:molybdenum cofactor guanylyltransferase [Acidobacteriota bacterium]
MAARLLGGVLVGGRSRRMGRPKQCVEIGGMTMIEQVVHALSGEVDEVVLLGAGPIPAALEGLRRRADADGCRGPMAGILGAMRFEPQAAWLVAPCDLPLLRPEAIRWLVSRRKVGTWVVFPSFDGFVEPLLALYESEARGLLETAAAAGEHALQRLARDSRVATFEPPSSLRRCWFNANTPQEIAALRDV